MPLPLYRWLFSIPLVVVALAHRTSLSQHALSSVGQPSNAEELVKLKADCLAEGSGKCCSMEEGFEAQQHLCVWDAVKKNQVSTLVYLSRIIPHLAEFKYKNGWTPLLFAAQEGHLDVTKFLAERYPHMAETNYKGDTPLFLAARKGYLGVTKFLAERYPHMAEIKDKKGSTPLLFVAMQGHLDVTKFLAERYPHMAEIKDPKGWTPLLAAAWAGHLDVTKCLAEHFPQQVKERYELAGWGKRMVTALDVATSQDVRDFLANFKGP
eukprot:TRINITY_DN8348_c0_g2_i2.p1 TRINITY_DN8348_c0_g2~~TRINITY_DN8348_c0_g2_i2.p1  ORF type:complete len:266 (+),score=38.55 TRINITY_DN8348_c0_g2_i2:81-878(+)